MQIEYSRQINQNKNNQTLVIMDQTKTSNGKDE